MKKCFFFIATVFILTACSSNDNLIADIEGWGSDYVYISYNQNGTGWVEDSVKAENGRIAYSIKTDDVVDVIISNEKGDKSLITSIQTVIMPNSKERIKGVLTEDAIKYESEGDQYYVDASRIRNECLPYWVEAYKYGDQIANDPKPDSQSRDIFEQLYKNQEKIDSVKLEYIAKNPNSNLSAKLITEIPERYLGKINKSKLTGVVSTLSAEVRNGIFKSQLDKKEAAVLATKNIITDVWAPDFTLKNLEGKDISLSDFNGKWVVVDFWGSWCSWCIKGFPDMKKVYDKYKGKLEIVGVACGDTDEKWRTAVAENKLPWVNLINNSESKDRDLTQVYEIEGYPTKIIIDPAGVIREIVLGEDPGFYKKLDDLINNIVK